MPFVHAVPLLLVGILIGLLLSLMAWGYWRGKSREFNNSLLGTRDDVLLGLVVLAAFAMGVFLTYALVSFGFFQ